MNTTPVPTNGTTTHPDKTPPEAVRVLIVATLLFGLCFAVWVMFGMVGLRLKIALDLTESQFAMLVAVPVLTGSLLRIPVGLITDRIGGRNMMMALLVITAVPTYLLSRVQTYEQALLLALFVGLAGTSFAAGVAWVSAWYPAEKKGFALGMFGLGNIGAALTGLIAPTLLTLVAAEGLFGGLIGGGWRLIPSIYAILLVIAAVVTPMVTPTPDIKPSEGRSLGEMLRPLAVMRVWRFGFYYFTVFGAFVGLTLWLPKYYVSVYDFSIREAGLITALFIFPASLLRPLGGRFSDKYGARPVIDISFGVIAICAAILSIGVGVELFVALLAVMGIAMGIAMAAVFTYIPKYFGKDVGTVGGIVGALGALGGFVLPPLFAWTEDQSGGRPESIWYVMLGLTLMSMLFLAIAVARLGIGGPEDEDRIESSQGGLNQ